MVMTTDALDRYWAHELGCSPGALYDGGIAICAPIHRADPRWMGWLVPLECVTLDGAAPGTGIISVSPTLANPIASVFDPNAAAAEYLPPESRSMFRFVRSHLSPHCPKIHRILHCQAEGFIPAPEVFPIDDLSASDLHADWFRLHFDGPIFVARDERGSIASWAAIKCKSDNVWEMAVMTEAHQRCRGLARSVVSRATQAAFDAGKTALYLHEITNHASSKVCRSLGYQPYGHEFTCETGRILPSRR